MTLAEAASGLFELNIMYLIGHTPETDTRPLSPKHTSTKHPSGHPFTPPSYARPPEQSVHLSDVIVLASVGGQTLF